MSAFAFGLTCVVLLMLLQQCLRRDGAMTRGLQRLACLTAPALFLCLLLGAGPATNGSGAVDYQHSGGVFVSFLGLQKPLEAGLRIGGSAASDFFVERVPGDVILIDGAGKLRVVTSATRGDAFSATEGGLEDFARQGIIPTWALQSGSRLCFASPGATACENDGRLVWTVDDYGRLLVSGSEVGAAQAVACAPRAVVRAYFLQSLLHRVPTAQERVFPLDIYGRPNCSGDAIELAGGTTLPQTFLHFGAGGQLYVSQLPGKRGDRSLVVEHGSTVVPAAAPLIDGARHELTVFRLQTSSPLPVVEATRQLWLSHPAVETGRSRLVRISAVEVRLLAASAASNAVPDTIEVMAMRPAVAEIPPATACRQSTVVNLLGVRERARPSAEESEQGEAVARVPFLSELGRIGATGALIEVERASGKPPLWQAHGCRTFLRAKIGLIGASGAIDDLRGSEIASLGTREQGTLRLAVAEYGVPGLWILVLLCVVGLARMRLRWSTWSALDQAGPICAVIMVTDVLLVIRLMVAIQEIAAQPSTPSKVSVALLTVLAVPLLLDVLIVYVNRFGTRARRRLSVARWLSRLPAGVQGKSGVEVANARRTLAMTALVALVPTLHLLLVLAGFREQVFGIRMTAILVPAYVVIFALLVGAACARWVRAAFWPWVGLLVCSALALIAFVLARDIGAVITLTGAFIALSWMVVVAVRVPGPALAKLPALGAYGLMLLTALAVCGGTLLYAGRRELSDASLLQQHPALPSLGILALVLGVVALWRWRTRSGCLLAAPGGAILLVLVGLSTARFAGQAEDCVVDDLRKVAQCLDRQSLDTNRLRLSYLMYPALTQVNLTGEARGVSSVFDELRWLTTQFKGQGFMSVPPRMGLDQHDNVIATHLIGPQGRTSAELLLALVVLPFVFISLARRQRTLGLSHPVTWLAYACFAFASIYMILANLLLVPFTGRNVYLTNAMSGTDLLEGGLLLLVTLIPLACARRGRAHAH